MKKFLLTILLALVLFSSSRLSAQSINPPSNLEAEPEQSSYIKVKWDDNSLNEDGFNIERSYVNDTASINWETIGSVSQNVRQFFDYWVTNQVTYFYRAYAFAGNVRSPYSNIGFTTAVIDTNHPAAPTELKVVNTTPTSITIRWMDNSMNETGFIIARRLDGDLLFTYVDTVQADILTYQETGLTTDSLYYYKVCAYNSFGLSDFTNTVSARAEKTNIVNAISQFAGSYFLGNNYPNPFNPSTNIKFGITSSSYVKLTVYNSIGSEIENLVSQYLPSGAYQIKWNAQNFSSGMYYYKIETPGFTETKKMLLIK